MMAMVILVVILWSSYEEPWHGHHSKMMTTSGAMVIILVEWSPERSPERSPHPFWSSLFFLFVQFFFGNFQMHRPGHADKYLANQDSPHCLRQ
jgi:hypothetical protein